MKRATPEEARAYSLTAEEAGHNTVERAHQLTATGRVLCMKGISTAEDWDSYLKVVAQERPWQFLPAPPDPNRKWEVWLQSELGISRDRLVLVLTGLMGTTALAEQRVQSFEVEILQPLVGSHGGKRVQAVPEQLEVERISSAKWSGSTNTGYLMARLQRVDPDVAGKIGKGKPYRSINHAAQELGIVARRQRYEVNPEVDVDHAADRILHVLGKDKAAELITALTSRLTASPSQ